MEIPFWFELLNRSLPLLLSGVFMTLKVLLSSAAISFSLGLLFGVFCSEELRIRFLSPVLQWITFILRAVPFLVQLLIVYFVLPDLLGINLDVFLASVISLGVCSAGYVSQSVRAGINSIDRGQWEAAFVLGYNKTKTLFYIILPQTFRNILPALNNELESILKSTAILSSIGMLELTRVGMNIVSRELKQPLTVYLIIASFYVALSLLLNWLTRSLEKKVRIL